ncbi:hypothetical protein GCM10022215_23240 [Nocardioides fonticola]|uniref:Endonuclease/exonuclease/phosphatase domain-containing protein n=1 Tax=Nocardioides fonticola TaxID=450363 RepID=A0ABP7XJZ9_9ACTN
MSARRVTLLGSSLGVTVALGLGLSSLGPGAGRAAATTVVPIASVQGVGDTTPLAGQTVTTTGVVTAAYPDGGLSGFYLQTAGVGGPRTPDAGAASDGLFVYQPANAGPIAVRPGQQVEVTGRVGEYAGQTQITVAAGGVVGLPADQQVEPITLSRWPANAAERESLEGLLVRLDERFTVADTYTTDQYGEIGLALGERPLIQPTDAARPGSAAAAEIAADNARRGIVLDDGASLNYLASANQALSPPYVSTTRPVRVGAPARFTAPVIWAQGGSPSAPTYRLQPTARVVGPDSSGSPIDVVDTRTPAPDRERLTVRGVPGVTVASFNVLNYFTTLGDADDDNVGDGPAGAQCTPYRDRTGDGTSVAGGCLQRGAWDPSDLARQQRKIVHAINALGADVVGLMEIENSARLGEQPDEALQTLVAALNAEAGAGTWAAVPSSTDLPDAATRDVITSAMIYRPAAVTPVGRSRALGDQSGDDQAFGNAREPIAQAFTVPGAAAPFLVVVNHFKSKGSAGPWPGDADTGDGQGASVESRVRQATALRDWVPTVQADTGARAVLLVGDFNSYAEEDPLQVLYGAGYHDAEQVAPGDREYSYVFGGLSGSLDHVLVNDAALASLTGADIWNINSGESVALEYSRWNNHGTDYDDPGPYRSSDHDPVVVGLDLDERAAATLQLRAVPPVLVAGRTPATVLVRVIGAAAPSGTVTATRSDGGAVSAGVRRGFAVLRLGAVREPGTVSVEVRFSGDQRLRPATGSVTVRVVGRPPRG